MLKRQKNINNIYQLLFIIFEWIKIRKLIKKTNCGLF